jgi:leucine dehydrogenase
MSPWDHPDFDGHEAVHFFTDRATGLKGIIAVHSSALGPGAGGVRFRNYRNTVDAVTDALRLSRAMSFKNAMAGLPFGGGKAVLIDDGNGKTPEKLAGYGRALEKFGGAYVTAADVGINVDDLIEVSTQSRYVSGLPAADGAAGGDSGPPTAYGVFLGIKAAVKRKLGADSLSGLHIAIQGAGSVGGGVARLAAKEGARVSIADVNEWLSNSVAAEIGGTAVDASEIVTVEADVLSPCALGAILNEQSIPALRTTIVAGGANNQLATPADGDRVWERGILFAPDYVINAGGIINVTMGYSGGHSAEDVRRQVEKIPGRLDQVWDESDSTGRNPAVVADAMALALIGR